MEGIYGPDLENPASWDRPKTPAAELRAFQLVRDFFLMPVLSSLQLKSTHSLLSVDGEAPTRPVHIDWDSNTARTITWTDVYGNVGPGMVVSYRWGRKQVHRQLGMIQIGGVVVDEKKFSGLPRTWFKQVKSSRTTKKRVVLTLQEWFLSAWGLNLLNRKPAKGMELGMWHKVTERDFGKALDRAFKEAR